MRLRNVANADIILKNSSYFIESPEKLEDISSVFSVVQPLHLEIGSGKGNFLIQMAQKYPDINFIGVEKYASVLVRAIQKCEEYKLSNIRFLCMDAKNLASVFYHNVDILYLNFSDPWPKKRHHQRRLTSSSFLQIYDSFFTGDAHIIQKTDNIVLFASSLEDLSQYGYTLNKVCLDLHNSDIPNIKTEYEEKFSSQGFKINYLDATKKL